MIALKFFVDFLCFLLGESGSSSEPESFVPGLFGTDLFFKLLAGFAVSWLESYSTLMRDSSSAGTSC